jgi:hypothetical protein
LPRIIQAFSGSSGSGIGDLISKFFSGGSGSNTNTGNAGLFIGGDPIGGGAATGTNFVERDMLTIIHKGEAVVPKAFNPYAGYGGDRPRVQQAASDAGNASRQNSNTYVTVNNNSSTKATTRESQRSNGDRDIIVMVEEVVANSISGGGMVHDSIQRRFGLNPGGSTPRY